VPSPAPSGADIADDMHDNTLIPYISDAIGFFSAFNANASCALMSTSSRVPSGAIARRSACIISNGWVMSWMQSKVVINPMDSSSGSGSLRGSWNDTLPACASCLFSSAR
jgi:hypothetical protein